MVFYLSADPSPPLPSIPGQVHVLRDEPLAESEWLEVSSAVLAQELGITRQAAWQRQQRLRERPSTPERTEP